MGEQPLLPRTQEPLKDPQEITTFLRQSTSQGHRSLRYLIFLAQNSGTRAPRGPVTPSNQDSSPESQFGCSEAAEIDHSQSTGRGKSRARTKDRLPTPKASTQ